MVFFSFLFFFDFYENQAVLGRVLMKVHVSTLASGE